MAKLLNTSDPYCSRLFVSCVDLATRYLIDDKDADPTLLVAVSFLNDTLRNYEQMDEPELIDRLKIEFETDDLSKLSWKEYLNEAASVFTYRLMLGGAHAFTENCLEISKQVFNILNLLK